jgi:CBS domain-containing protein
MSHTIAEVMTANPITISESATLVDASEVMREADIGSLIVMHGDQVRGIVTDRDIVVRAIADALDPREVTVGQICSADITAVAPTDGIQQAVDLMRDQALRRLPVVDDGRPVGIVSLGDLATEREPMSALAEISDAPPNT